MIKLYSSQLVLISVTTHYESKIWIFRVFMILWNHSEVSWIYEYHDLIKTVKKLEHVASYSPEIKYITHITEELCLEIYSRSSTVWNMYQNKALSLHFAILKITDRYKINRKGKTSDYGNDYNEIVSRDELIATFDEARGTTEGADNFNYQPLKHLPDVKKIWWIYSMQLGPHAIFMPTPNTGQGHSDLSDYHPIKLSHG